MSYNNSNGGKKRSGQGTKRNNPYYFDGSTPFINPYTFVPVSGNSPERIDLNTLDENQLHGGSIQCRMILKTPLLIPDTAEETEAENGHKTYPFMKIGGQYTVPGSSIRGPVRSVYEAATNSCFATLQDAAVTVRTDPRNPFKPGLLIHSGGEYLLKEAKRYTFYAEQFENERNEHVRGAAFLENSELNHYRQGECVRFLPLEGGMRGQYVSKLLGPADERERNSGREKTGYLYTGESGVNKKDAGVNKKGGGIFCLKNKIVSDDQDKIKTAYRRLKQVIEVYQDPAINRNLSAKGHHGYKEYQGMMKRFEAEETEALPIWYNDKNGRLYFSTAAIGRFGYEESVADLIPQHASCTSTEHLCRACALFGMVGEGKDAQGAAGRVRFSDAVLEENSACPQVREVTLDPLSSPKPSYRPFYVYEDNYFEGYDADDVMIRGRKFYWHHQPEDNSNKDRNQLNATMQEFRSGSFRFQVYYDGITAEQLKELVWILCMGENCEDGRYCYKIGHAKPLGYGSVKIVVDRVCDRRFRDGNYQIRTYDRKELLDNAEAPFPHIEGLMKVMDIHAVDQEGEVRYPYVAHEESQEREEDANKFAAYRWFAANERPGIKQGGHFTPKYNLPNIEDEDQTLPAAVYDKYGDGVPSGNPRRKGRGGVVRQSGTRRNPASDRKDGPVSVTVQRVSRNGNVFFFDPHRNREGMIAGNYLKNRGISLSQGEAIRVKLFKPEYAPGRADRYSFCGRI